MPQPSTVLQALLASLVKAKDGTTLVLDAKTVGATGGASLLRLFSEQLRISSVTLDDVVLPPAVTDNTLAVSGGTQGVTLALTFQDVLGEVAVEALFQAPGLAALKKAFPDLPAKFFDGITVSGTTADVSVPGLARALSFASPRFGVVGLATPLRGLVTTSIAPRVDGEVAPPSGAKQLFVELQTTTSGYRIGPLSGAWQFPDFGWLMTGLDILGAFPPIIPTHGLGLRTFDLNLYPQAPNLSSLSLDVADTADPNKPLWSAAGGKVALTDVVVTVGLTYSKTMALSLTGTGSLTGNFSLGSLVLAAQIPFPVTGVWSLTAYPGAKLTVLDDLATLLTGGAGQLNGLMPAGLSALGSFELTYVRLAIDAGTFSLVEFSFALGSTAKWKLIPGVVELDSLRISMTVDGTPSLTGSVVGTIGLPQGAQILVTFGRNDAQLPWRLDVVSPAIALPDLGQLAQLAQGADLGSMVQAGGLGALHFVMTDLNFGLTVSPAPAKLTNLGLTLQLANAADPLNPTLDWPLIPGVLTLTDFSFGFQLNWGDTSTKDVFGKFVLNDLEFDVKFADQARQGKHTDALIAEYSAQGKAGTVDVKLLIHTISPSVAQDIPEGLTIDLADALLAYLNTDGTKKYLFAMDVSVEFPLSDLPFVGKALPAEAKAGLKNLKLVVASAAMSANDVAFINGLSPRPVLPLPPADAAGNAIPSGFSMVAELELGSLSLLMTSPPAKQPSTKPMQAVLGTAPATDPVYWIDVQKTFGPVSIQKVGFSYHDGSLFVLSNLGLATGGLEIDLLGIGVGSPIAHPSPKFTIQGLAVSFIEGPISVMGGMLGTLQPVDFVGALSVRAPELALAAFAGYATYEEHPSFFLYGVLNAPIGGPPPFFVTGLAAGLGFNRKLAIPDVGGVATFPLIAWAQGDNPPKMDPSQPIGGQVADVLTRLAQSGVVAPSVGDYWFAVGVQFTSFEIIKSFALITVSLGADTEIALLGLSTMTLPPDDASPVAEIQLALEVAFAFDKGLIAVAGQLTNNSYVLSRACRLTGGFAYYLWFRGDHAGETVLSVGGYNPNFKVPDYYPVVPRLGLNWQVTSQISITGELYFALTTNVVMAGGKLSAVWNSGPISAWFTYWADFLMTFSPFHYYIDGGIDLGASFTIDLGLFSISITIHIGVDLALWGPEFAGRATINLSIISFTIRFNDHDADANTAIPWDTFLKQLLPSQPAQQQSRQAALEDVASPPPALVQINVTAGLIRALKPTADGPCYLIHAETFQCAVLTVIPNKSATFAKDPDLPTLANVAWAPDARQPLDSSGKPIAPNQAFGAGPANVSPDNFQPTLALTVTSQEDSTFHAVRRFLNAPKALWENKAFDQQTGVPQVDPQTALTQGTIANALVGLTLIPYLDRADRLLPIPLESLLFTLDTMQPFAWSPGVPPTADPFTGETVAGTITAPAVATVRSALLGALAAQGVAVSAAVDVSRLENPANDDLQAAPRLRLLGEQAAA